MIVALLGDGHRARCRRRRSPPREPGAIRAGPALRPRHPRAGGAAGADGAGRHARLQLPGGRCRCWPSSASAAAPTTYAALVSAMAVGSIAGALVNGAHGRTGPRLIAGGALAFGVSALLAAAMPDPGLRGRRCWPLLGGAAVTFAATINSTLQLAVSPEMRGRVMALYSVVFLGSTPIGGAADRLARRRPTTRAWPCCWPASPASAPPGPPTSLRHHAHPSRAAAQPHGAA